MNKIMHTYSNSFFIICQKGKVHYQVVGYHIITTSEGDTTIVLELGKREVK